MTAYDLPTLDGLADRLLPAVRIARRWRLRAPVLDDTGEIVRPGLYVTAEIVEIGVGWVDCRTPDGIERHWIATGSDGVWLLAADDGAEAAAERLEGPT